VIGSRSRPLLWLLGLLLASGTALGTYWRFGHSPWCYDKHTHSTGKDEPIRELGTGDPSCPMDPNLELAPEQLTDLWNIEHGGNLLMAYGFKPMAAALRQGDEKALTKLFSDKFQGQMLSQPREVAWRTDWMTVVRQMDSGQPPMPRDRKQFIERLLDYRRQFHTEPSVKIALMMLAPVNREEHGPWQGTCQLRMWGEKAKGQPCEIVVYLSYRIPRP